MISSLLNVAYLLPIVIRGFYNDPTPPAADAHHAADDHAATPAHLPGDADGPHQWTFAGLAEAPPLCLGAIAFTAFGCLCLFVYADTIYNFLLPVVGGAIQ